jgi:hypothetical protein
MISCLTLADLGQMAYQQLKKRMWILSIILNDQFLVSSIWPNISKYLQISFP